MNVIVTRITNSNARILVENATSVQDAITQAQQGKGTLASGNSGDNWTGTPATPDQVKQFQTQAANG